MQLALDSRSNGHVDQVARIRVRCAIGFEELQTVSPWIRNGDAQFPVRTGRSVYGTSGERGADDWIF